MQVLYSISIWVGKKMAGRLKGEPKINSARDLMVTLCTSNIGLKDAAFYNLWC